MKLDTNTLFASLSNDIRLRCLVLLQLEGELCVCELTHALKLSQPMISRHLGLLRDSSIVNARREGQWIYYSLNEKLEDWALQIIEITAESNRSLMPFSGDLSKLKKMPNRPGSACCA